MQKMDYVFYQQLKYVGNEVDMSEKGEICLKWLKYLTKVLNVQEMTQISGKWLQYVGNGLII